MDLTPYEQKLLQFSDADLRSILDYGELEQTRSLLQRLVRSNRLTANQKRRAEQLIKVADDELQRRLDLKLSAAPKPKEPVIEF